MACHHPARRFQNTVDGPYGRPRVSGAHRSNVGLHGAFGNDDLLTAMTVHPSRAFGPPGSRSRHEFERVRRDTSSVSLYREPKVRRFDSCPLAAAMTTSVIHYKFKTDKKWETITFDGQVISVLELKRAIVQHQKLAKSQQDFDLLLQNKATGEGVFGWSVCGGAAADTPVGWRARCGWCAAVEYRIWCFPSSDFAPREDYHHQLSFGAVGARGRNGRARGVCCVFALARSLARLASLVASHGSSGKHSACVWSARRLQG